MTRTSMKAVVVTLGAAALIAVPGGLAATPQQIYQDYADNGRLDGTYSRADLDRALSNAAVQAYGGPGESGIKPAVETSDDSAGGQGTAGQATSSGPPAVTSSGGLPFTGLDLGLIAAGAAGLLLFGAGLRRVARQRQ